MTDHPRAPVNAAHASHDPLLIAAMADRDRAGLSGDDRTRAEAWIADCAPCAALHSDLVSLGSVLRTTPTPSRMRDFRLTEADAQRLRPPSWRRAWRMIGTRRDLFTRPLAMGFTTLGIVGLLVGTLPSMFSGSTAQTLSTVGSAVGSQSSTDVAAAATAPAASAAAESAASAPAALAAPPSAAASAAGAAPNDDTGTVQGQATASEDPDTAGRPDEGETFAGTDHGERTSASDPGVGAGVPPESSDLKVVEDAPRVSALILVAGGLLVVGLALFGLRWRTRHPGDG